jgi:hypothetical protein
MLIILMVMKISVPCKKTNSKLVTYLTTSYIWTYIYDAVEKYRILPCIEKEPYNILQLKVVRTTVLFINS